MSDLRCYRLVMRPNDSFPVDAAVPPPPPGVLSHIAGRLKLPVPEKWIKAPSLKAASRFRDFYKLREHFLVPWAMEGASGELDFEDGVHAVVDDYGRVVETGNCRPEHWQDDWRAEIVRFRETVARLMPAATASSRDLSSVDGDYDATINAIAWYRNDGPDESSLTTLYGGAVPVAAGGWAVLVVGPLGVVLNAAASAAPLPGSPWLAAPAKLSLTPIADNPKLKDIMAAAGK